MTRHPLGREDRDWLAFLIGHTTAFAVIAVFAAFNGPIHFVGPLVLALTGVSGIGISLYLVGSPRG